MANNSTENYIMNINETSRYCAGDTPLTILFKTVGYVLLLLLSFVGNVLVIDIIRRNQTMRSAVDLLIGNMCVSDLAVPIVTIPYRISEIFVGFEWFDGVLGAILCKLVPFAMDVSSAVSILSMLAIAIERFRCVLYPTKPIIVSVKSRHRVIALIWVLAVIFHSIYFYTFRLVPGANSGVKCRDIWYHDNKHGLKARPIYYTALSVILFIVPLIIISILYSAIIVSLRRQKAQMAAHLASAALGQRAKQNRNITFMILIVVVVFALAYSPFVVFLFLALYRVRMLYGLCNFRFISLFLFYTPTAINPVVYFTFNDKYRQGLRQLLCCRAICQSCRILPGHNPDHNACAEGQGENNQAFEMNEVNQVQ